MGLNHYNMPKTCYNSSRHATKKQRTCFQPPRLHSRLRKVKKHEKISLSRWLCTVSTGDQTQSCSRGRNRETPQKIRDKSCCVCVIRWSVSVIRPTSQDSPWILYRVQCAKINFGRNVEKQNWPCSDRCQEWYEYSWTEQVSTGTEFLRSALQNIQKARNVGHSSMQHAKKTLQPFAPHRKFSIARVPDFHAALAINKHMQIKPKPWWRLS